MKTIYRSHRDKKLFGVCGGLAEAFGIDSTILRLVTVVATIFSSGAVIPVYIIAALVMPRDPMFQPHVQPNMNGYRHGWGHGHNGQGHHGNHGHYGHQQPPFGQTTHGQYGPNAGSAAGADLDGMMNDLEKKALQKEIEQLKAKLAKIENNNKGDV
ncbi:PspC domain-containing protein [Paenibacillus alkalitolerans]|uniref:PspC domain-containing protein n=1 Tax=Paenibacillus alkalitolerans TaxID=2799335 RepID=UPI0018F5041E|nr:PspC domain-containing protein [Paenibacillus alkalitolerans]